MFGLGIDIAIVLFALGSGPINFLAVSRMA
jgi:hypothetical protein